MKQSCEYKSLVARLDRISLLVNQLIAEKKALELENGFLHDKCNLLEEQLIQRDKNIDCLKSCLNGY